MNNLIKSDLYGNTKVWHNLVNNSLTNQVAHAYIFAGPSGIGKLTTAKEYIKYLLQANDVLKKRIDEDSFLDLLYISKQDKNEITIDAIRKAHDFFNQTAAEGKVKFVIIDSADDLNRNAANALLKILEEPTPNTHLFLISHIPSKLLATIRSRCRIIKFQPLTEQELKSVVNMNKFSGMEDFIAGSPARALSCSETIKTYKQLLELIKNSDIIAFNKFTDHLSKQPQQWQLITELLTYLFCRCMKVAANCLSINNMLEIEREILPYVAKNKSIEKWSDLYYQFSQRLRETDIYNLDRKQILLFTINDFYQ